MNIKNVYINLLAAAGTSCAISGIEGPSVCVCLARVS